MSAYGGKHFWPTISYGAKPKATKITLNSTRSRKRKYPVDSIDQYLSEVYLEALQRKFNFDKHKINWKFKKTKLAVATGQVNYEVEHLFSKLEKRDSGKYKELKGLSAVDIHPGFKLVDGGGG